MITITTEKLDAYAVAKASQADEHDRPGHKDADCILCETWVVVKQSARIAAMTHTMARNLIVGSGGILTDCMISRDLALAYSLGLSAGLELAEADELTKLEALGGR